MSLEIKLRKETQRAQIVPNSRSTCNPFVLSKPLGVLCVTVLPADAAPAHGHSLSHCPRPRLPIRGNPRPQTDSVAMGKAQGCICAHQEVRCTSVAQTLLLQPDKRTRPYTTRIKTIKKFYFSTRS